VAPVAGEFGSPLSEASPHPQVTIYAAPLFHTGDERYAWLNRVQAVAKGTFPERGKLVYEIYELV